ncbi:superoxide dismutase [Latilactobacillus graminis]|uniref:Superoxide dismutase n=2 Tax=Latilactobacillus graminis TaxID=60519 RepID=A0AA89L4P6_9LACO|nr:superoxide dismutase [Latilactobacillus graminis]KRM22252.1 superoxide dismutase [Latilactobacillus graminis DSM 20719]QFP79572.1 superoxide dismutase [Latilactobacillus graminis]
MTFKLPVLPYDYVALEPYIDSETLHLHHDKHHKAYVTKLNAALTDHPDLAGKSLHDLLIHLDDLPENLQTPIRNNGGGHANHSFFWRILTSKAPEAPTGELLARIELRFGQFNTFQTEFTEAALSIFGSGWAWLVINQNDELQIMTTSNQDSPLMSRNRPLIGLDVWEHAYYLKYQNNRIDYIENFWKIINWPVVAELL